MLLKLFHVKCPLNRYTFKVSAIKKLVEEIAEGKVLNLFAGLVELKLDEIRNDLDGEMNAEYHMDALAFIKQFAIPGRLYFNTVLLDPPYSYRKSMEMYHGKVTSPFNALKDAIPSVLNKDGLVITFGYHSIVMGSGRGFKLEKVYILSHGGAIHDTIVSVERLGKITNGLSRR